MQKLLPVGSKAPEFTLRVTPDQNLSLSELQGKPVILMFYPADWSPVCGDEAALFAENPGADGVLAALESLSKKEK